MSMGFNNIVSSLERGAHPADILDIEAYMPTITFMGFSHRDHPGKGLAIVCEHATTKSCLGIGVSEFMQILFGKTTTIEGMFSRVGRLSVGLLFGAREHPEYKILTQHLSSSCILKCENSYNFQSSSIRDPEVYYNDHTDP